MMNLLRFLMEIAAFVVICLAALGATSRGRWFGLDRILAPRDPEELRRKYKERHPF